MEKKKSKIVIVMGVINVILMVCLIVLWVQLKQAKGEAIFSFFNSHRKAVVMVASLNVRDKPDSSSKRIGTLVYGETVTVLNKEDEWSYIEYKGAKGYVMSAFLSEVAQSKSSVDKNKAERNAKDKSEIGRFTQDKKSETDFYTYTENGFIRISIPNQAVDVNCDGSVLSYHIRSAWSDVLYTYEIDDSIIEIYDTERKINAITSSFVSSNSDYRGSTIREISNALKRIKERHDPIPTIWTKNVGENGASYCFTGLIKITDSFSSVTLYEEAYNFIDGITVHEKVIVRCVDFDTYKQSFDTTMGQNQAEEEFTEYVGLLKDNITCRVGDAVIEYTNSMNDFIELFMARRPIDVR